MQFLAFSGSREQEALRVRWADDDLTNERVTDDFANIGRLICTAYGATYRGRDG